MMNEKKKQRALNVFSAMGSLPDEYVNAAESALYEAEAGLYRPARPQGPVRRFLNSGWGVALISGIAALAAVTLILRAGQDPGVVTPPVGSDPATDTETEADGTDSAAPENAFGDFTMTTDQQSYPEGTTSFLVNLTGKQPGKPLALPGEWHLFLETEDGPEPVIGMYYTGEAIDGIPPDENTCAALSKRIFVNPHNSAWGLTAGSYVLRAVVDGGYVECRFTVEPKPDAHDPALQPPSDTEALGKGLYTAEDTELLLTATAVEQGFSLISRDSWSLYRKESGQNILVGRQAAETVLSGLTPEKEYGGNEAYALSIRLVTGGVCDTLPKGEYELLFEGRATRYILIFTVTDD